MPSSRSQQRIRKLINYSLAVAVVTGVVTLCIHLWFAHNARKVLKQIVYTKSNGNMTLDLKELSFDLFSNKIKIREADLLSVDSINQASTYHVKFRKLTLRVNSFWPLVFQNKLLLDSIKLHDPEIEVFQWKKDTVADANKKDFSVTQQLGKLYNSMLDGLEVFGIRRIIINNAKVSLINKIHEGEEPVTVSNIYLDVKRAVSDRSKRGDFIKDEQTVDLNTTQQDIALPGGRHKLSFKKFYLQLFKKRIIMDSCTVTALATDSSKNSYSIFFKRLSLIGVDFNAMYLHNLIKADSVYCENPLFHITLESNNSAQTTGKARKRPDPDKIVRELITDLDLSFIGVKNAGIHIDILGKTNRELFNSNKDNFEMRGLKINSDSSTPVHVDRFDMLVRDYHLYNEDSTSAYTFDSLHFLDSKIVLNNFAMTSSPSKSMQRNKADFSIPYFELSGVDWYELIFDQRFEAREAYLENPNINFIKNISIVRPVGKPRSNMFSLMESIEELVSVDKVNIVNGKIQMKMGQNSFNFKNAFLRVSSNKLLQSTNNEGVRGAVDHFSFSDGVLHIKDITAKLVNARYTGNNLVQVDDVTVTSTSGKINGSLHNVFLDNLVLDDDNETMVADGIRWQKGNLTIKNDNEEKPTPIDSKKTKLKNNFKLNNIAGNNTSIKFISPSSVISAYIKTFQVASMLKPATGPMQIEGLNVNGDHLSIAGSPLNISATSFQVNDHKPSSLKGLNISNMNGSDSLSVKIPSMTFSPELNDIFNKKFHVNNISVEYPIIRSSKKKITDTAQLASAGKKAETQIIINQLVMNEPDIIITTAKNDSITRISIPRADNSILKARAINIFDGVNIGNVILKTSAATFVKPGGDTLGVSNGNVDVEVSDISIGKAEGKPRWNFLINSLFLENPNSLSIGKNRNRLIFKQAAVGNLSLSSDYVNSFDKLLKFNVSAWLKTATGEYSDSTTTLKWYNADYNYKQKTLSLDSFAYYPTQSKDSVLANTPHQTDYITLHTGQMQFIDFNLEKYKKDSAIIAKSVAIFQPYITITRDMKPPFIAGKIKPLPVDIIKGIKLPLAIENLKLLDGNLQYSERNAKTRAEGTIILTRLNATISNVTNANNAKEDSLRLTLNAYLMDSAKINLSVKESYTDSLAGFLMTLRMRPTNLTFLNPVLAPMSNVKFTSGTIDSFHLRAIGNDALSLGEMNMYYHNLKIKLIKGGDEMHTTHFRSAISWLVNTLLIKRNNNGRTGLIYFERLRDHSFFNYLVKMTFSGMTTSIGVKKNGKLLKKYKAALQQRSLPPIDFDSPIIN
ncbi:MAG: hypothetical protein ABIR81_12200 [Ginsengibacter sp.]